MLKPIQRFYYVGPKEEGPLQVTFKCVCLEAKRFKVHLLSLFTLSVVQSNPSIFPCFVMWALLQTQLGSAPTEEGGLPSASHITNKAVGCTLLSQPWW